MIIPDNVELKTSTIPNAGKGIFAKVPLKKGTVLGDYEGEWIPIEVYNSTFTPKEKADGFEYGWEIRDYWGNKNRPKGVKLTDNTVIAYVDGKDPNKSNYLRYVNHPSNPDDENITSYQLKDKIVYVTARDIAPGEELFVNYGPAYGEILQELVSGNVIMI